MSSQRISQSHLASYGLSPYLSVFIAAGVIWTPLCDIMCKKPNSLAVSFSATHPRQDLLLSSVRKVASLKTWQKSICVLLALRAQGQKKKNWRKKELDVTVGVFTKRPPPHGSRFTPSRREGVKHALV